MYLFRLTQLHIKVGHCGCSQICWALEQLGIYGLAQGHLRDGKHYSFTFSTQIYSVSAGIEPVILHSKDWS